MEFVTQITYKWYKTNDIIALLVAGVGFWGPGAGNLDVCLTISPSYHEDGHITSPGHRLPEGSGPILVEYANTMASTAFSEVPVTYV